MAKKMENYMDNFENAEAYIRHEVLANRGTHNIVDKYELLEMVVYACPAAEAAALSKCSKEELFDRLVAQVGLKAYAMFDVGVSSNSFQKKFDITHKDVLFMAKKGFLQITGKTEFRMYGRYCTANTYSPYQYFQLTREEVHEWLDSQCRKDKQEIHKQKTCPIGPTRRKEVGNAQVDEFDGI